MAASAPVNYAFTAASAGEYSVTVMADPARPELATTDMALNRLWNRTITLLARGGILLALTIASVVTLIRRLRAAQL